MGPMEFDLASVVAGVADAVPDRECLVHGDVRRTYGEFVADVNRFAHALHAEGLGAHTDRSTIPGHRSGQDHLALYLHNGAEFLIANVGAFAARVAPFNVNYRYVDDELVPLWREQQARAVVFHSAFASVVERVAPRVPAVRVLVQVPDGTGAPLVAGARWWDDVLDGHPPTPAPVTPSPDDLYVLCTGGTTGTPKGVLWRQADIFVAALGGVSTRTRREFASLAELVAEAVERGGHRNMPTAPFMHGAAQWSALTALTHGNTVVVPTEVTRLDPVDVWSTVERERVSLLQLVGDAFARPLLDELDRHPYDLTSLRIVVNGGAILSASAKQRLLDRVPGLVVVDGLGSSEAGPMADDVTRGEANDGPVFSLGRAGRLLREDRLGFVDPPDPRVGWLASTGRLPLGYLGDADRTAATFPVVDGVRCCVAGDRARFRPDGTVELLGRDAVTINTGGEKVFAEEVEQALLHHPAVADAVVCGRPSPRWGSEVVAVVALRPDAADTDTEDLRDAVGEHLARFKVPKAIVVRDHVVRSPAGKADYEWARAQVTGADGDAP